MGAITAQNIAELAMALVESNREVRDLKSELSSIKYKADIDRRDAIEAVANADKWQEKFDTALDQLKDAGIEFDAELPTENA